MGGLEHNVPVEVGGSSQRVFAFGIEGADGHAGLGDVLGGKGAGLAEMARLGLPVPPGFTIAVDVCSEYRDLGDRFPADVWPEVTGALRRVERAVGGRFGLGPAPVLVSVRSGAAISMPGMMDTVLNVGLNDEVREALATKTGDRRMALDSHRRLIEMFARAVMDLDMRPFDNALDEQLKRSGAFNQSELDEDALEQLLETYGDVFQALAGTAFFDDPEVQLRMAVESVFRSWSKPRAVEYRALHGITDLAGTAVNVQAMVFGNMGELSATGVCFTRDPATGDNALYGEFLENAQGEDVVSGIRTPHQISDMRGVLREPFEQLLSVKDLLERHYRDMQDMEFTVEAGRLWMLQTRSGKRTAQAAVRIAVDLVREGLITEAEALDRVEPNQVDRLVPREIDRSGAPDPIAVGLPASPGVATGRIVFSSDDAQRRAERGLRVVLVRNETSIEDVAGLHASEGVLTAIGGMTSHAAVVARGMGKPCVTGCSSLRCSEQKREVRVGDLTLRAGDWITFDGSTGEVFRGELPTRRAAHAIAGPLNELLEWGRRVGGIGTRGEVRARPELTDALELGADGIRISIDGILARTGWVDIVRRHLLLGGAASDLEDLEQELRDVFRDLVVAAVDLPVVVALPDRVLEGVFTVDGAARASLAKQLALDLPSFEERVARYSGGADERGLRGCRLAFIAPELLATPARALLETLADLERDVCVDVVIAGVQGVAELVRVGGMLEDTARQITTRKGRAPRFRLGMSVGLPRTALMLGDLVQHADVLEIDVLELTRHMYGMTVEGFGSFLPSYVQEGGLPENPFSRLDVAGVGQVVRRAVASARVARPEMQIGAVGVRPDDAKGVAFCHGLGIDYLVVPSNKILGARLVAARASVGAS